MPKVEALVNLNDNGEEKNYIPGDILVVRPEDSFWGIGDLQSRIVVQIDMPDFPCGEEWGMRKCVKCEHHGIVWPTETLADGTVGTPKVSCPKEQYEAEDMAFTFSFNAQGIPVLDAEMKARRMGKINIDTIISPESKTDILNEIAITEAWRDAKLVLSRKESNLVTMDSLEVKTVEDIKVITK